MFRKKLKVYISNRRRCFVSSLYSCWLSNPLCSPRSCSSACWQLCTSIQNSPGGDLQTCHCDSTPLGWTFWSASPHQSYRLHHVGNYFKFHFPSHGSCLNFPICIWFLYVGKSGLWRAGRMYMPNTGHEEWIHNMYNKTGEYCNCARLLFVRKQDNPNEGHKSKCSHLKACFLVTHLGSACLKIEEIYCICILF